MSYVSLQGLGGEDPSASEGFTEEDLETAGRWVATGIGVAGEVKGALDEASSGKVKRPKPGSRDATYRKKFLIGMPVSRAADLNTVYVVIGLSQEDKVPLLYVTGPRAGTKTRAHGSQLVRTPPNIAFPVGAQVKRRDGQDILLVTGPAQGNLVPFKFLTGPRTGQEDRAHFTQLQYSDQIVKPQQQTAGDGAGGGAGDGAGGGAGGGAGDEAPEKGVPLIATLSAVGVLSYLLLKK